jgi:hypothetical protein
MVCLQCGRLQVAHSTSGKLDISDLADDPDRSAVKNLRKVLAVL